MEKWEVDCQSGEGADIRVRTVTIEAHDERTARDVADENIGVDETQISPRKLFRRSHRFCEALADVFRRFGNHLHDLVDFGSRERLDVQPRLA